MDVSEGDEDLEEDRLPDLIREDEGPEPRECWVGFILEKPYFYLWFLSVENQTWSTKVSFSALKCSINYRRYQK